MFKESLCFEFENDILSSIFNMVVNLHFLVDWNFQFCSPYHWQRCSFLIVIHVIILLLLFWEFLIYRMFQLFG